MAHQAEGPKTALRHSRRFGFHHRDVPLSGPDRPRPFRSRSKRAVKRSVLSPSDNLSMASPSSVRASACEQMTQPRDVPPPDQGGSMRDGQLPETRGLSVETALQGIGRPLSTIGGPWIGRLDFGAAPLEPRYRRWAPCSTVRAEVLVGNAPCVGDPLGFFRSRDAMGPGHRAVILPGSRLLSPHGSRNQRCPSLLLVKSRARMRRLPV